MDAVALALGSAFLFGSMTVLLRPALARGADPYAGALLTVVPALAVGLCATAVAGDWNLGGLWPFFLAGILGPGMSQILFTLAVRDAGASRTSATVGTAPLFAVVFAVVLLDEPLVAGIVLGAALIVGGGVLLVGERDRPDHVRAIGFAYALGACLVFASRDTLVRWLAVDSTVSPEAAVTATLAAGTLTLLVTVVARRSLSLRRLRPFALPGICFGLSYVCLFEAYFRGRLSVVSPLVATESLWGVGLSAVFLCRRARAARLMTGALLVVSGGMLIGVFR